MNAYVQWHGGLTFNGTADSGFTLPLGGSSAAGGNNDGFRPMELILLGLAGCTGMDVISILRKMRQDVTDFQVQVESKRSEQHPKVFTYIRVHYIIRGHNLKAKSVERAIQLSRDLYCPAQAMLAKGVDIQHTYEMVAETSDLAGLA